VTDDNAPVSGSTGSGSTVSGNPEPVHSGIDASAPHSARIWNYWLGGKDNYAIDREVGDDFLAIFPGQADIARYSRTFLGRAVTFLAGQAGIRQFLDIGTGLPTADNTHEVAQRVAPESRIVYVDNDPLVLVHARALLTSDPRGTTAYIDADLHDPDKILAEAAATLDFSQPVAVIMLGVLGHIPDSDDPGQIVARVVDGLPSGSYLVINDGTNVLWDPSAGAPAEDSARARAIARYAAASGAPYNLRTPAQIEGFFGGLELVEPGVVSVSRWRAEAGPDGDLPPQVDAFSGVARKP
jgi:O-methyltransferase involved in polyketide biosynthesis